VIVALQDAGGWENIKANLQPELTHAWTYMGNPDTNPMGIHFMSLIFGLGFVMSFGYWCTDFLVVQRAMIAKNMNGTTHPSSLHSQNAYAIDRSSPGIAIALSQPGLADKGQKIPLMQQVT
jgi:SSS family solute:Na+ symporter